MIVALIPARSGSKGFEQKYTPPGRSTSSCLVYQSLPEIKLIDRVLVSTDSDYYATIAKSFGAGAFLRPPELSTDTSTDYDFVKHALDWFRLINIKQIISFI